MEPQEGGVEVDSDTSEDEDYNGPPDAEFAENGSSELLPKSAFVGEDSSEGPYKGCRILEWWQDANKSWWVKVLVDGQWVPYQEVSSTSSKQRTVLFAWPMLPPRTSFFLPGG